MFQMENRLFILAEENTGATRIDEMTDGERSSSVAEPVLPIYRFFVKQQLKYSQIADDIFNSCWNLVNTIPSILTLR